MHLVAGAGACHSNIPSALEKKKAFNVRGWKASNVNSATKNCRTRVEKARLVCIMAITGRLVSLVTAALENKTTMSLLNSGQSL